MNRDERRKLLSQSSRSFILPYGKRATFHARGVAIAGNPGAKCNVKVQVRYVKIPAQPMTRSFYGVGLLESARRKKWVGVADPQPSFSAPRVKRTARISALSKIASQLPAKLPVGGKLQGPPKCACFRKNENQDPPAQSVSKT